jgi:hydroxylamine reductase
MTQILEGIKVLDLTRLLPGPLCTQILGDLGAQVIKVEGIKGGDYARSMPPRGKSDGGYFLGINRNKRSINLDFTKEKAKEIFFKMLADSDVVIEQFRPGVMEELGLGYQVLSSLNPRIIMCSISGYGQDGVMATENEDIRSLRELLTYGIKGMAAYAEHAYNLGYEDQKIYQFMHKGLAATLDEQLSADELIALVLECGQHGVEVMALLDKANTSSYGNPEITRVNIGVRNNPAILISGHDLRDLEELLKQSEGTGVDIYTHSEMLPANYYPAFKQYSHFVGNYGNAWWQQNEEFEKFNGPILMTTNCIIPPRDSYRDRVYTTGSAGYEGIKHIADRKDGKPKDFSVLIEHAKKCAPPQEIEKGEIIGGFAHNTVLSLADTVVAAVKSGAIKRFFVMAGCDGRMKSRSYYTEFARQLPDDTIILTAGCAKYRYNKLDLGFIGGIPRVLDAGQCNDSYSLAVIALKLKEVFGLEDINQLPISYNIAWYEQKAVIVLLALLYLGVKNIHLGPTLPAFLSPHVAQVLVKNFGIAGIGQVEEDIALFMGS